MHVCAHACMYVCMYVCMYIIYIYIYIGMRGKVNKGYRGKLIKERATGQNVSQPEIEDFVHEDSDHEEEVTEVREAMAAVRVE
jgi:hypothetical protein